ncbi:ras-induced vulval development antagonist-domain-containing protein [Hysterangium stoloniferum]|nr:ras-induced vulval development antagonist-domain-containing protein [Hysterangium stoloniferum]
MATVHPSRMGLIIQDSRDNRTRSRSPEYNDYRGDETSAPWRVQENMYPERRGRDNRNQHYGSNGGDYIHSRQQQRDSRQVSIWPPSPKAPGRDLSPGHKSHKRSRKRDRSSTPSSDSSSSEEERRRRERRVRKNKEKEERRERRRHRDKRRSRASGDEDDSRQSARRSADRGRRTRSVSNARSDEGSDEDEWVEKGTSSRAFVPVPVSTAAETTQQSAAPAPANPDSDGDVGPQPLTRTSNSKVDERSFGGALLRGEGSAMAAFLAEDTNARIPRRGEIGLTSDEIATYEAVGYVMSGSRHRRMNAVRMRKENQVISAEEKRGILKLQKEERARREEVLREEFKELVSERLKAVVPKKP